MSRMTTRADATSPAATTDTPDPQAHTPPSHPLPAGWWILPLVFVAILFWAAMAVWLFG